MNSILNSDDIRLPHLVYMNTFDMKNEEREVMTSIKNFCILDHVTSNYPFLLKVLAQLLKNSLIIVKYKQKYWHISGQVTNANKIICFENCFLVHTD